MTKKSKIYTGTGDHGQTSLVGGERLSKDNAVVEAYGTIDELSAFLAHLIDSIGPCTDYSLLEKVQHHLFSIGGYLATPATMSQVRHDLLITEQAIVALQDRIDEIDSRLPPMNKFVVPAGGRIVANVHIVRAVCRRAERRIVTIGSSHSVDEKIIRYMNRLSDYLFVMARLFTINATGEEKYWDKSCK